MRRAEDIIILGKRSWQRRWEERGDGFDCAERKTKKLKKGQKECTIGFGRVIELAVC